MPTRSVCAPDALVPYADLPHRSRMGKISAIQMPKLDHSLVHTYRTLGGGGQRFMNPSDRPAGGGEPSSQLFTRVLCHECFVFEFRYSGGKTPLIIVTMLGMFAIASLTTWLHRRWISRSLFINNKQSDESMTSKTMAFIFPLTKATLRYHPTMFNKV